MFFVNMNELICEISTVIWLCDIKITLNGLQILYLSAWRVHDRLVEAGRSEHEDGTDIIQHRPPGANRTYQINRGFNLNVMEPKLALFGKWYFSENSI